MRKINIDDIIKRRPNSLGADLDMEQAETAETEEAPLVSEAEPASADTGEVKPGSSWSVRADKIISKFLTIWITLAVFATPLIVVSFVYPAQALGQLALAALALFGALLFLARAFWLRGEFSWQKSVFNWGALALAIGIILDALFSGRVSAVLGFGGFIPLSSPMAWLGPVLLALLIIQHTRGQSERLRHLLAVYCLASTLLALFVFGWYFTRNQMLLLWGLAPQVVALWLALNAVLIFSSAAGRPRLAKWLWFFAGLVHAALLFFFDYDVIWYVLGGGLLFFGLLQYLCRKNLPRRDFIVPQLGVLLSAVLLLLPAAWIFGGSQPVFNSGNLVNFSLSNPRYYKHIVPDKKLLTFGVGPGFGTANLWQLAELADMRQAINFPQLANGYLAVLWEGGLLLAAAFLFFILSLFWRVLKGAAAAAANPVFLPAFTAFLAALVAFYFLPLSFIHLFSLFFLAALLAGALIKVPSPFKGGGKGGVLENEGESGGEDPASAGNIGVFSWRVAGSEERQFFAALATAAPLGLLLLFGFVWARQFDARISFLNVITRNSEGAPVVNVDKLQRAIDFSPGAFGYRLSRNDIALQLLRQQDKPKFSDIQNLFAALRGDSLYLLDKNLTGAEKWQLAWQAELTAANLELKEFADKEKGSLNGPAKEWYQAAGQIYEQTMAALPRNVILLTEAARFYRQHAALLAGPDAPSDNFYERSKNLAASALAIDPSYEAVYLEKVELAAMTKSPSEALAEIAGFADKSPNLAFRAGQLAYAAKNYNLAVQYYGQAVARNENHLAARYELVRSYAAAGEPEKAKKTMADLEPRVPKDDAQAAKLMKDLRDSLGNAPAEAPAKPAAGEKLNKR